MKGGIFGSGPPTTNGTRLFWKRPEGGGSGSGASHVGSARVALGPARPLWMDERQDLPCRQHPASWWFAPEENEDGELIATRDDMKAAKRLCNTVCPMRLECADHGLRNEGFGIWGGIRLDNLKADQRRDLLARILRARQRRAS